MAPIFDDLTDAWDLIKTDLPVISYYVKPLIQKGKITAIFGQGKNFKSSLALYMALCIATDKHFFAYEPDETDNVLWIDEEMGMDGYHRKLKQIAGGQDIEPNGLKILSSHLEGFTVSESNILLLKRVINDNKIGVVIIDSITRILGDADENSSRDVARIGNKLRKLTKETGVTIIFIHHTPKSDKKTMRGSVDWINQIDRAFSVERNRENQNLYTVTDEAIRYGTLIESFTFRVDDTKDGYIKLTYLGTTNAGKLAPKSAKALGDLTDVMADGLVRTFTEIQQIVMDRGNKEGTTKKIINDAINALILTKVDGGYKIS